MCRNECNDCNTIDTKINSENANEIVEIRLFINANVTLENDILCEINLFYDYKFSQKVNCYNNWFFTRYSAI